MNLVICGDLNFFKVKIGCKNMIKSVHYMFNMISVYITSNNFLHFSDKKGCFYLKLKAALHQNITFEMESEISYYENWFSPNKNRSTLTFKSCRLFCLLNVQR